MVDSGKRWRQEINSGGIEGGYEEIHQLALIQVDASSTCCA